MDISKNMSVTERYWMASTAKSKLSKAAAETERNLRLLVGHANLLDNLMEELDELKRRNFQERARPRLDTVHEVLEELVQDGESDDELGEGPPEPGDVHFEELSLSRSLRNHPRVIQIAKGAESRPEIRLNENTFHASRSQRFYPALDSIEEETLKEPVEHSGRPLIGPDGDCTLLNQAFNIEANILPDPHQLEIAPDDLGGQVLEATSAILGALSEIRVDPPMTPTQPSTVVAC